MHHIPTLFAHHAKRIRLLAASIHAAFLNIDLLSDQISTFLADAAPPQLEAILGTWCIAAHDIDRAVSAAAAASWTPFIPRTSAPAALARTFEFCQRMVLDPLGTYTYLNPPQPAAPPPPAPHARTKTASRHAHGSGHQTPVRQREDPDAARRENEHEEAETDRKARLRVGAFGAIGWLLSREYLLASPRFRLRRFAFMLFHACPPTNAAVAFLRPAPVPEGRPHTTSRSCTNR